MWGLYCTDGARRAKKASYYVQLGAGSSAQKKVPWYKGWCLVSMAKNMDDHQNDVRLLSRRATILSVIDSLLPVHVGPESILAMCRLGGVNHRWQRRVTSH